MSNKITTSRLKLTDDALVCCECVPSILSGIIAVIANDVGQIADCHLDKQCQAQTVSQDGFAKGGGLMTVSARAAAHLWAGDRTPVQQNMSVFGRF